MRFRPIGAILFNISGWRPLGESSAMYRRLSSLRKAPPAAYLGRPPQTGQSTVHRLLVELGSNQRLIPDRSHVLPKAQSLASTFLQRSQMETAVYVDHLARRIREIAARDGRHRATYILRLSPSPDGPGALLDHSVVFLLHAFGHVGGDDAGAHLVNVDAVFGQPRSVESRHHRQPRLRNAVVAAIDRCGVRRD